MRTRAMPARLAPAVGGLALVAWALGACSGSGESVTVNGDVPIAYVKRSTGLRINPTDGTNSAPGGDLIVRERSSASAVDLLA